MGDRIQPENNRAFKTGSGNWGGSFSWNSGTLDVHQGYITLSAGGIGGYAAASLHYPYIKPKLNAWCGLDGALYPILNPAPFIKYGWLITDGVYTDWGGLEFPPETPAWFGLGGAYFVPNDWNLLNTALIISIHVLADVSGILAFDSFSLSPPTTKRQYLPIMGIG